MGELRNILKDLYANTKGLGENALMLGTSAIAEPVAGYAAMFDPVNGAQAIREGMTYQPRTEAGRMYQQGAAQAVGKVVKPVMPVVDTWQRGVDIAGRYSPTLGALMQTAPTALGVALGAKPTLQAGRQASNTLGAMQARMIVNANAPRTLNTGFMGQRGTFAGINALTADKEALAKAQNMIAQGVDPAKVWQETGWGRGADGKWRFEIDDSKAKLRDYQFTPRDAYEYARKNAFISGDEQMINRAKEMGEYASMTKTQLKNEYKKTGNEIVDAAISGDIEKAKQLSEKRSGLDSLLSQMSNRKYGKASSFIAHGDLGQAYPDVYKIHTRISQEDAGTAKGYYNPGNEFQSEQVVIGRKPIFESDKSTMLHELQHAIQKREGFARGGNPEQFKGIVEDPFKSYQRLAGEVEARMTQNRMNLNAQQRRENYPFDYRVWGYDVPSESQIVDFRSNKAMSQRPLTEFEQAHLIAQRNAALPVSQGGLGLAPDNTAMDRARAMGFAVDTPVYHGTGADFDAFDPNLLKETSQYMKGIFTTDNPNIAGNYGDIIYPLVQKQGYTLKDKRLDKLKGITPKQIDTIRDKEKSIFVTNNPQNIRSRFAAFDPMKKESSNLLAQFGALAPTATMAAYLYNQERNKGGKQ